MDVPSKRPRKRRNEMVSNQRGPALKLLLILYPADIALFLVLLNQVNTLIKVIGSILGK